MITPEELDAKVLAAAKQNHIWLNAFACLRPTDEIKIELANTILNWLNNGELLVPSSTDDGLGRLQPMLYLSINKS